MKLLTGALMVALIGVWFCADAQKPSPSWWDRVQDTYSKAVAQGRPVADKFARQFPKKFAVLKQNTLGAIKKGQEALNDADLKQKESFALELWRVRQSLDLATLLSPGVLKELTGLDIPTLDDLKARVAKTEKSLEAQIGRLKGK